MIIKTYKVLINSNNELFPHTISLNKNFLCLNNLFEVSLAVKYKVLKQKLNLTLYKNRKKNIKILCLFSVYELDLFS